MTTAIRLLQNRKSAIGNRNSFPPRAAREGRELKVESRAGGVPRGSKLNATLSSSLSLRAEGNTQHTTLNVEIIAVGRFLALVQAKQNGKLRGDFVKRFTRCAAGLNGLIRDFLGGGGEGKADAGQAALCVGEENVAAEGLEFFGGFFG